MSEEFKEGCEFARDLILSRIAGIKEGLLLDNASLPASVIDRLYEDLAKRFGDVCDDFKMVP